MTLYLAIIATVFLCLACFPGIAFAVSPAPESGTENTQIVESDSTPAETSSSVQAATSDSTPAATPNNVQAAAPDNIQSTVPESTQTAAPNNIQTAAPDNAQAQSSDSAPAATSDGAPAETSGGTQAAAPDSAPAETSDGTQAEATDKETLPLLIIVAGFSNVSYRDDFDWAEAIFNGDESLAAYYDDMSLGQFTFVPMNETCSHESGDTTNKADKANDGIVHVTLELEHSDWTVPGSEIFMSTFGSALLEMIKAADRFVDFASYDTNHDGELSSDEAALGFVIAGYEAAVTRDYSQYGADKYLWSHAFWLDELLKDKYPNASYYRPDGVLLSPYIAISEQERTDMQSSIGTLAHELEHYLGLPDLYDVVYADDNPWSQYSTSFLCLMDAGSWGYTEDGRSIPTALSAACRYLLGWLDSIIVTYSESLLISPQDFSAPPNNSGYVVAKIPIDGRDDEFYLVENRRYSGWDEALKPYYGSSNPNGGLVFWHIDMSIFDKDPENVNGTDHHQAIMPLFIEKKANGDITFIGDSPNIKLAFFDAELWNSLYASALGDYLVLPQYGTDPDNDVPSARTLSQLKVSFAAAEGDSVLIRLADKPPDPATPTKGSPSEAKAALPATGDPLQAGTFAALFGCSLALLSICLLRRRFKSR